MTSLSSRPPRVLGVFPLPGYNLHLFPLPPTVSPSLKIFLSLLVSRPSVKSESPGKISPYLKDIIRKLSYFEQLIQPTNFLLLYTGLTDCAALALHCTALSHDTTYTQAQTDLAATAPYLFYSLIYPFSYSIQSLFIVTMWNIYINLFADH